MLVESPDPRATALSASVMLRATALVGSAAAVLVRSVLESGRDARGGRKRDAEGAGFVEHWCVTATLRRGVPPLAHTALAVTLDARSTGGGWRSLTPPGDRCDARHPFP